MRLIDRATGQPPLLRSGCQIVGVSTVDPLSGMRLTVGVLRTLHIHADSTVTDDTIPDGMTDEGDEYVFCEVIHAAGCPDA